MTVVKASSLRNLFFVFSLVASLSTTFVVFGLVSPARTPAASFHGLRRHQRQPAQPIRRDISIVGSGAARRPTYAISLTMRKLRSRLFQAQSTQEDIGTPPTTAPATDSTGSSFSASGDWNQETQGAQLVERGEAGTSFISAISKDNSNGDFPLLAVSLLNLVAIIWGTQHAIIKTVVDDSSAAPFTFLRFALAALIASPYTPGAPWNANNNSTVTREDATKALQVSWRWGLEMGLWMFLGFSFQAIGIGTTTAQRSGFLLYLNVKLVPFFSRFLFGRPVSLSTWISALAAFCGTSLLALDGESIGFNIGDVWSIAAAAASAMFILRLESASKAVSASTELNSASLWVVTALSGAWTLTQRNELGWSAQFSELQSLLVSHPWAFIYLSGVTTALANYIQTKAQKEVSPERASIIYSLDPVYGAFFSWLLLGEELGGAQAFVGAGLVTGAAILNAFFPPDDKDTQIDPEGRSR